MEDIPFKTLWKLVQITSVFQIVNATIDIALWITRGFTVPAWALALSVIWYTVLIFALYSAMIDEGKKLSFQSEAMP